MPDNPLNLKPTPEELRTLYHQAMQNYMAAKGSKKKYRLEKLREISETIMDQENFEEMFPDQTRKPPADDQGIGKD